jgi:uncharacterized protein YndB with AHSA1/START domain
MQLTVAALPERVFRALTDAAELSTWFAEHADISLAEKHYDFWGRFTPDNPDRAHGHHTLLSITDNRYLKFQWQVREAETTVEWFLEPRDEGTLVILRQANAPPAHGIALSTIEDFWFLSLENLRRHLDGRPLTRCDFSAIRPGDITHSLEIDGLKVAVFDALINPQQLERWIASQATVEPRVGGTYDLGWKGAGRLKILELIPDEKLSLEWPEGERTSVVTWTLAESGGKTRLTLVHSGFGPDEPTGGLNAGWLNFMGWVRSLVEYGPAWAPPALWLKPDMEPFYAASIGGRQHEIRPLPEAPAAPPEMAPSRLGNYVEITTTVPDVPTARAFYLQLGFRTLAEDVVTDGSVNIRLVVGNGPTPVLSYAGSDPAQLQALGISFNGDGQAALVDPGGLRVTFSPQPRGLPAGKPLQRQSSSRCGIAGEFTVPCPDRSASLAFWTRLGFASTLVTDEPYPWAILTDGLVVVGLHQTPQFTEPYIVYFARDMLDRIHQFQAEGLPVTMLDDQNGMLTAPGGQKILLFSDQL